MNSYVSRLNEKLFYLVKNGTKTIEMRVLDEKRSQFKVGDILIFKKRPEEIETITTKIVALHKFPTFKELYAHFDKKCLGYTENEIAKPEDMEEFYSKKEQNKYGVVGIEIRVLS